MMNKKTELLRWGALSLAVAGGLSVSSMAAAEGVDVSAAVGVANMYLWRGMELGDGDAAVSGDLRVSAAGFYTGIWGSSGDSSSGTEYDLYVGYGAEFAGVTVDLSVWNYVYPNAGNECGFAVDDGGDGVVDAGDRVTEGCQRISTEADDFGGISDAILTIEYAGFGIGIYDNIAGASGYEYYSLSYTFKDFSVLVGKHDNVTGADEDQMVHVDLGYAYNDNLKFTLSQQVDQEEDKKLKFVVSYELPLGD